MASTQIILFIGKGGVGKTTCAVSTALHLADRGVKTLLVSLDPAHNAGDAFACPLNSGKTTVSSMLDAVEIDLDTLIQRYLEQTSATMKHTYRYLTVFNLERLFEVIRYSPGIEEYATLEALKDILSVDAGQYDTIIFDTAPTGLTLRVLALPSISNLWIQKLSDIRKRILSLRSSIEHIHGKEYLTADSCAESLASTEAEDSTMQELQRYHQETSHIHSILTNPDMTNVVAVLNAEEMPLLETQRAAQALEHFHIPLNMLIVNKILQFQQVPPEFEAKLIQQQAILEKTRQHFPQRPIVEVTWQSEEPCGLDKLRHFTSEPAEYFLKHWHTKE